MNHQAAQYLEHTRPFANLPRHRLGEIAKGCGITHLPDGESLVLFSGEALDRVFVVSKGAAAMTLEGERIDILAVGDVFGQERLFVPEVPALGVEALGDAVFVSMPLALFRDILMDESAGAFFRERGARLRIVLDLFRRAGFLPGADPFLRLTVGHIPRRPPVFVNEGQSVAEAARIMTTARSSSCLVRRDEAVIGIITERDIVAAMAGVADNPASPTPHAGPPDEAGTTDQPAPGPSAAWDPARTPVAAIMSPSLVTVGESELLFEAFSRMVRRGIRRLVAVDEAGRPTGVIEEWDLLASRGENPVHLSAEIARARDVATLAALFGDIRRMTLRGVDEDIPAENLGRLVSEFNDRIMARLTELVARETDKPPGAFCLAVLGSEGRKEQFLATDQDNALIIADGVGPEADGYFAAFADRFIQALLAIGFPPCPNRVMIDNPAWRMTLSNWMNGVDEMILSADGPSILALSLLTDARPVAGDSGLCSKLREYLNKRVKSAPVVLKYMAREALRFTPPIGFFNNLVVERAGPDKGWLDVKKGGIFPLTQGLRTLALEHGLTVTGTSRRLSALRELGVFSESMTSSLWEAYAFLQTLRVRAQALKSRQGHTPDNLILPSRLSSLERDRLKDCLKIVAEFQGLLHNKYGLRLFT
ncbi:putative nucleotidyltransferase substrate binding domain-containing protein [Desulfolutivibrio sulfoxidireducens]|uniref:putative nucleotidyltransferase substrate binding domain-containing protein n=1 Tax=Desulfolutivibrio sulfoxidireducens TaxID=2773299 RepID=UPI00159E9229|nr:putative nucleotidyltransferase substrate binding domain-containing protein [Desulfolutivibrio sulfoxidireducens]QLA19786.1 CBS domain-containing protein [Desulfolutivibrio sulfoxidireducens]